MDRSISQNALTKVLDAIKQEADMDGVVTATDVFIAKQVSLDPITVFFAIHKLIELGEVKQIGRVGKGHVRVLQIVEEL